MTMTVPLFAPLSEDAPASKSQHVADAAQASATAAQDVADVYQKAADAALEAAHGTKESPCLKDLVQCATQQVIDALKKLNSPAE